MMKVASRVAIKHIKVKPGETFHVSCFSDLHLESSMCDLDALDSTLRDRSKLKNHSAIIIGDAMDLVGNRDLKRYRRTGQIDRLHGVDAWLDEAIDHAVETLSKHGVTWDLVGAGNHEDEWLKRHGTDVTSILASRLGATRGGYSGVVDYRIDMQDSGKHKARFRLAYHHGAWGGKYAKGYLGAKDWAYRFEGWNVFVYGHCHSGRVDYEQVFGVKKERYIPRTVYLVNASSWVDGMDLKNAANVHYTERAGYTPQPHRSPLIRVTPRRTASGGVTVDYSVEV